MATDDKELLESLRLIEKSTVYHPSSINSVIELLESRIPPNIERLFHVSDKDSFAEFMKPLEGRLIKQDGQLSNDKMTICKQFFQLIALLKYDLSNLDKLPTFFDVPSKPGHLIEGALNITDKMAIDRAIEISLSHLGHKHENDKGTIDEKEIERIFPIIATYWQDKPETLDWLRQYLSFRLMRDLLNVNLFYAMHGPLPHYREFKIIVYLMMIIGREEYKAVAEFARLCHGLGYGILMDCSKVFIADSKMEDLTKSVEDLLVEGNKQMLQIFSSIPEETENVRMLTLRIMAKFFKDYFDELSETGRFHILLWCFPMYREVREAFRGINLFGGKYYTILIIGETGTGKESIAQLFLKSFGERPLRRNCAGLTLQAMAEDLFKVKPDASALIDEASALFLDELDKTPLDAQGGLLNLLDKPCGEFHIPGEFAPHRWSGLVIAAATELIFEKINNGQFLADLFWRFDSRPRILPIRDMMADNGAFGKLFKYAVGMARGKFGVRREVSLSEDQIKKLEHYSWPGNLREVLQMADAFMAATRLDDQKQGINGGEAMVVSDVVFDRVFKQFSGIQKLLNP